MRFGIDIPPLGQLAEPGNAVRLATAAEAAGWEAVSTWDHLGFTWDVPAAEPFVLLAAIAARTERIRVITSVLALPRRPIGLVAQSVATLDRLSGGRLTVGVGAGGEAREFEAFGDPGELRHRLAALDARLDVLDELLRGERVERDGLQPVRGVTLAPLPVQRPRPPIWVGAQSEAGLRRAARFDGWLGTMGGEGEPQTPDEIARAVAIVREARRSAGAGEAWDAAIPAVSPPGGIDVGAYEQAGLTWWLESLHPMRPFDELLARVEVGPPR